MNRLCKCHISQLNKYLPAEFPKWLIKNTYFAFREPASSWKIMNYTSNQIKFPISHMLFIMARSIYCLIFSQIKQINFIHPCSIYSFQFQKGKTNKSGKRVTFKKISRAKKVSPARPVMIGPCLLRWLLFQT